MDLEQQIEQSMKEIEYLRAKNILSDLNSEKNNNESLLKGSNEKAEYYEKQLNDSNNTIRNMGEMIKELEKQIEELQKEIENNNYMETKNNKNNNDILELVEVIKKKIKKLNNII